MAKSNPKLQQYQEIQAMVQKEIQTMFGPLYSQYAKQFGVNKVPTHTHNGTDAVRIQEVNLDKNIKYGFGIQVTYTGNPETVFLRAIPNMSKVTLHGFAANNVSVAATKRALFSGHAAFGKCFTFPTAGVEVTPDIAISGIDIIQGGNAYYTDSTDLTKTRVAVSNEKIIYVTDDSGAEIISMTIDSYQNGAIQLTADIANADWQFYFSIIMS